MNFPAMLSQVQVGQACSFLLVTKLVSHTILCKGPIAAPDIAMG